MALTPTELYETYSTSPCVSFLPSPFTQISQTTVYNNDLGSVGAGTPMNLLRLVNFLKHVKYPCVESAPGFDENITSSPTNIIKDTGAGRLILTYRFLQTLDAEAYHESQPTVEAGTSYSVRNCCDLSRACHLYANGNTDDWGARMATEYLQYFCHRSLPDCLMMCGPDLVDECIAQCFRAPGLKVAQSEKLQYCGDYYDNAEELLDKAVNELPGMLCFPMADGSRGVAGARHGCWTPTPNEADVPPKCYSYQQCPTNPVTGAVINPDDPCCQAGSIYWGNECLNSHQLSNTGREIYWSYWIKSDDGYFDGTILNGRVGEVFKHIGILKREMYDGLANFLHQCSGAKPPIALDDIFLNEFQKQNDWDYNTNKIREPTVEKPILISRARTMSIILKASIGSKANVSTDTQWMVDRIKDLLYNGYGVMLSTNVGFNNIRDSTGVSYPDRIFYHTYNIIGYDDTKTEYNECVYILQLPFGAWNKGGQPYWGNLPPGSFVVTESHLKCIIQYYPTSDLYNCRARECVSSTLLDCDDPAVIEDRKGCGADIEGRCTPYYCTDRQSPCGLLIAISFGDGFEKQSLNHNAFLPIENLKEAIKARKLYYQ